MKRTSKASEGEEMKQILYDYDIYPKVFLGDREQMVTVQALGDHVAFQADCEYTIKICKVNEANPRNYPERSGRLQVELVPCADGCLRFSCVFEGEGEHYLFIYEGENEQPRCVLSVYSLAEDMAGRIPYRGDLHMHTCRSDGREAPAVVAANYRGHGYDFFTISDHHRYYPSIEAIEAFGDLTDFTIVPGEEVHLPLNDVHYVNFGGLYSINALVKPNYNEEKAGDDLRYRSMVSQVSELMLQAEVRDIGSEAAENLKNASESVSPAERKAIRFGIGEILQSVPEPMSQEAFEAMIREKAKSVPREYESERLSFAVMQWVYEHVKAGGGLGIFPHPYWLCPMMQVAEDYTEFIYTQKPFDAFEVLGGEPVYSHNGFQTGFYYEMKVKGIDHPIVGSTDSHGSTEHNAGALLCSTIVFAKENTREALIEAIKEKYSLAVDTNNCEYRLVGDFRLMKYGCFLMEHYFPLHDQVCKAEGYYMNRYLAGDARVKEILAVMKGQIPEMQRKYFEV